MDEERSKSLFNPEKPDTSSLFRNQENPNDAPPLTNQDESLLSKIARKRRKKQVLEQIHRIENMGMIETFKLYSAMSDLEKKNKAFRLGLTRTLGPPMDFSSWPKKKFLESCLFGLIIYPISAIPFMKYGRKALQNPNPTHKTNSVIYVTFASAFLGNSLFSFHLGINFLKVGLRGSLIEANQELLDDKEVDDEGDETEDGIESN